MLKIAVFHRPSGPHGGDTQVASAFTRALVALGHEAVDLPADAEIPPGLDWAHIWAACSPDWGLLLSARLRQVGVPFTISPEWYPRDARQRFYGKVGDIYPGYIPGVTAMMQLCDGLACATMGELRACWDLVPHLPGFVMGAALEPPPAPADIELPQVPYAICIARIEPHKNQGMALMACQWMSLPILFVGEVRDQEYAESLKANGANLLGFLPDKSRVMAMLRGAIVHVLPSFGEIVSVANQEAAFLGTPMVIGNTCHDWEYFGDRANYCDPTDWRDIAITIQEAMKRPRIPWIDQPTWESVAKRWLEWIK